MIPLLLSIHVFSPIGRCAACASSCVTGSGTNLDSPVFGFCTGFPLPSLNLTSGVKTTQPVHLSTMRRSLTLASDSLERSLTIGYGCRNGSSGFQRERVPFSLLSLKGNWIVSSAL